MKVKWGTSLDYTRSHREPLLRYRTGDLVCPRFHGEELILEGGILGRVDDMVIIRGVTISQRS